MEVGGNANWRILDAGINYFHSLSWITELPVLCFRGSNQPYTVEDLVAGIVRI